MEKIVITGFGGFVASYFLDYLFEYHPEYEVYGIDNKEINPDFLNDYKIRMNVTYYKLDLMNANALNSLFELIKPDYVLHLAALSSVAYSWQFPEACFINNCNIFLNLIQAVRNHSPECRVLSVGSSEEYGNVGLSDLPIRESLRLNPVNPYAIARVSQELLSKTYVDSFGMQIIMTRSFNHIGPRQDDRFVIPSFVKRILDIKKQMTTIGTIETGDLSIKRDFVDVRDVVDAYYKLLISGSVGEVYNICSGTGIQLSDVVKMIADELDVNVITKTNPQYVRPNDNMEMIGDPNKIETELGWRRKWSFKASIRDIIEYQKNK